MTGCRISKIKMTERQVTDFLREWYGDAIAWNDFKNCILDAMRVGDFWFDYIPVELVK